MEGGEEDFTGSIPEIVGRPSRKLLTVLSTDAICCESFPKDIGHVSGVRSLIMDRREANAMRR